MRPNRRKEEKLVPKEIPKGKDEVSTKPIGKTDSQSSRNRDVKIFKCLGICHVSSQCPNKRVMIMQDNGEVV